MTASTGNSELKQQSSATASNNGPPPSSLPQRDYIYPLPLGDRWHYPLAKSLGNPTTSRIKKQEECDAMQELGYRVYELKEARAKKLYAELTHGSEISNFLKGSSSGYDAENLAWLSVPYAPASQNELCWTFATIMNAIIEHFHPSLPNSVAREAVDSHGIPLVHDNGSLFSLPGICIKATGSSFESPEHAILSSGLGYTNVAAVVDVQPDAMKGKRMEHCRRSAVFNRQIFIQQPNRNFSRSLVVTEKVFRLIHYDRSGLYVTPLFDIHKDAALFVQFVVGLSSPNEQHLGLDTSVQWSIDEASGKKIAGTIELCANDEATGTTTQTTYNLDMTKAPYVRPDLRGRGTVAWHAFDGITGEPILVKDAWHTDARESECKYLSEARGIPGVVEMVAFQEHIAETADYRPPRFKNKEFRNRSKLRVAMKKYGPSIWFFRSRLHLLCALLDALVGHHTLFERNVIHRDISIQNILLGQDATAEGYRGTLIDLDMAARTKNCVSSVPADPSTGTRLYQSISVIRSLDVTPAPPQDYMDELESLFYVLCHLIYAFKKPGVVQDKIPQFLEFWDMDDLHLLGLVKEGFSLTLTDVSRIPPYWSGACVTLLKEFHDIIRNILNEKMAIRGNKSLDDEGKLEAYGAYARKFNVYYEQVKSAFEKAISSLQKEGLNQEELEPYPIRSSSPPTPSLPTVPSVSCAPTPPPTTGAPLGPRREIPPSVSQAVPATGKKRPSEDTDVEISSKRLREDLDQRPRYPTYAVEGEEGLESKRELAQDPFTERLVES